MYPCSCVIFAPRRSKSFDVQIDRPRADGASAGKRNTGASAASHQRPENQRRRAHLLDQFVRRFGAGQIAGADGGAMLRPSVSQFDFGAHGSQQFAGGFNVAYLRDIFQDDWFFGEQGSSHGRQRGVLGAADPDCPQQRIAAANYKFVHTPAYLTAKSRKEWSGNGYSRGHGLWGWSVLLWSCGRGRTRPRMQRHGLVPVGGTPTRQPAGRRRYLRLRAAVIARRTWPPADFNARSASRRSTFACSMTSPTGTLFPAARKACSGNLLAHSGCLLQNAHSSRRQLRIPRSDVHHEVSINVSQPGHGSAGEHVQHHLLRRAGFHAG